MIWGNVPQRIKNFTGRREVFKTLERAPSSVTVVLPHALQGMGGVGKTSVAIEYAYRYRSQYQLVWWIPADQPALVRSSLAALAEPLGLPSATSAGIETAAAAVLDALRRGDPYDRWLLIFDNADQPEDLNDIIPRGPGDVLITSRNHRWNSVVDTVQVDVWTRAESTAFLARRIPRGISEPDADDLAEDLGDLPLALEQAGALMTETGMPVDEYRRLLQEHTAAILAEGKSPDYPLPMTAAWTLSVSALSQQLPEAMELLRCCAFFDPEPIPRDLFRRSTHATNTRIGGLLADPILLARAIREMGRFSLVKIDGRMILIHRLVQALLREEIVPAQHGSYRHEVHIILAAGAPQNPDDHSQWPRYAELVAHVTSPTTRLARCPAPEVRELALNVVRYLFRSGDHASASAFAEQFAAQWAEGTGPDAPDVIKMQRLQGNALRELGAYSKAYALDESSLKRARDTLGEQDQLTMGLTNSFAADLRARGDFAEARELDRRSLRLHEEVLGPEDPQTLRVMNNLALDHGLNSNYAEARELHQRTYVLQSEARVGVSTSEVLNSWNGLARALRLCGEFAEARDVGEDAYDYGRELLGPEHYLSLRAGKDLSIALRLSGTANDDALALAEDVYGRYLRVFFEGHPDTLAAAVSLTNAQRVIGVPKSAVPLAEKTVEGFAEVYGPDHPYSLGCQGNLALLRRTLGDAGQARELDQAALAGLDARLTRDHDYTLTVAVNLASDLAALGEIAQARALGEDTLTRLTQLMGPDNAVTLGCAANLVADLRADGAAEQAEELAAQALRARPGGPGSNHHTIVTGEDHRVSFDFDPPPI